MYIKKETEGLEEDHRLLKYKQCITSSVGGTEPSDSNNYKWKESSMKLKRILSGLIGFPIVALIFIYGNTYIIDAFIAVISIIAMYEYLNA